MGGWGRPGARGVTDAADLSVSRRIHAESQLPRQPAAPTRGKGQLQMLPRGILRYPENSTNLNSIDLKKKPSCSRGLIDIMIFWQILQGSGGRHMTLTCFTRLSFCALLGPHMLLHLIHPTVHRLLCTHGCSWFITNPDWLVVSNICCSCISISRFSQVDIRKWPTAHFCWSLVSWRSKSELFTAEIPSLWCWSPDFWGKILVFPHFFFPPFPSFYHLVILT